MIEIDWLVQVLATLDAERRGWERQRESLAWQLQQATEAATSAAVSHVPRHPGFPPSIS